MAKIKFSIDRDSLFEDANNDYALTRVPNSNMKYYMLIHSKDVVSNDDKTVVIEHDSEKQLIIWDGKPSLDEAISAYEHPEQEYNNQIKVSAAELDNAFYNYADIYDPKERAKVREERQKAWEGRQKAVQKQKPEDIQSEQKQAEISKYSHETQQKFTTENQQANQIQHYSKEQFREIRKGVSQRLDTRLYQNIELRPKQMRELRLALKRGMDVTKFNSPYISAKHMRELRLGAQKGVGLDLGKLDQSLYNADQIHELRLGFEKKLNMNNYLNPAYSAAQIRELRLGQQAGFDTRGYEDLHLTAVQMHSIRQQMVLSNISEILKKMCEDIRKWLSEKIESVTEALIARYQGRESMTPEQIKESRINEAVEDIKDVLIQSELIPESAYENKELSLRIKDRIEELVEYAQQNPEQNLYQPVKDTAIEVCSAAGAKLDHVQESKVVSMNQEKADTKAMEEAIEEAVQQAYEMDEMMEEETFEMMQ